MRRQFPLHYALFKRVSSHMCHEGNAESTFSLSGGLSNGNKHTDPAFLSTMVRTNKNKHIYDPPSDIVFKAYRSKFGKVPNEDKVEYDSEPAVQRMARVRSPIQRAARTVARILMQMKSRSYIPRSYSAIA